MTAPAPARLAGDEHRHNSDGPHGECEGCPLPVALNSLAAAVDRIAAKLAFPGSHKLLAVAIDREDLVTVVRALRGEG